MPQSNSNSGNVALYWDFDNISSAVGMVKAETGSKYVDFTAVMEFVTGLGDVVINRGYADWTKYTRYKHDLMHNAVDLVQLFPRGSHAKNGADIRLVLDALEDAYLRAYITHFVIIGGDSDYIALSNKLRQMGRTVIGIGVRENTNPYWIEACSVFKLYGTLVGRSQPENVTLPAEGKFEVGVDLEDAKDILVKAVRQLASDRDDVWVKKAGIKGRMQRLDNTFDEGNYGFRSFNEFARACSDVIEIDTTGEHDHLIAVRSDLHGAADEQMSAVPTCDRSLYERTLSRQGIRMVPPQWRTAAMWLIFEIFNDSPTGRISSFDELYRALAERLDRDELNIDATYIRKLRDLLYKARMFDLLGTEQGIAIGDGVTYETWCDRLERFLLERILTSHSEFVDPSDITSLIYDDAEKQPHVEAMIEDMLATETAGQYEAAEHAQM